MDEITTTLKTVATPFPEQDAEPVFMTDRIAYWGNTIGGGENLVVRPDGFLICKNVPFARCGAQQYMAAEVGQGNHDGLVTVHRLPEDVCSDATLASFEGVPFVDGHPLEDVTPANASLYAVGHIENVRRGDGDLLLCDIWVQSPTAINKIVSGDVREVSAGYLCKYETLDDGRTVQRFIRGNHLALVPEGRAGKAVRIQDCAPLRNDTPPQRSTTMPTPKTLVGRVLDWANRLKSGDDGQLVSVADELAASMDQAEAPAPAPAPANPDEKADMSLIEAALAPVLARIEALAADIAALKAGEVGEEQPEKELDALIAKLDGCDEDTTAETEEAVTVPAEEMTEEGDKATADAQKALILALKPAIAALPADQRKLMVDALQKGVGAPSTAARTADNAALVRTTTARAQTVTGPRRATLEECRAELAKMNPHNKEGK